VYPPRRITVNLAPADQRKAGASLDLAIALGILLGSEQVRPGPLRPALVGELSLGGEVRHVPGLLPMARALARRGARQIVVASDAVAEARLVPGLEVHGVGTLGEAVELVRASRRRIAAAPVSRVELATLDARPDGDPPPADGPTAEVDLAEVRGQLAARRALEIALAGGHAMLMVGPPGSGKTLLARTIPGLQPPLGEQEALAATIVASVAGGAPLECLVRRPPFRAPHHTASYAAMVGGGPRLSPGEVTLADHGCLFLDELPEFSRDVLEALRQPLEEGRIEVARVGRATVFPARFLLVAAMNPCPCGMAGSDARPCTCRPGTPERYLARISGPLRDRIDLWVEMPRVPAAVLTAAGDPEDSATVAGRIAAARARAFERPPARLNAWVGGRTLRAVCQLDARSARRLVALAEQERLSGRGADRLLRVARTIADLAGSPAVGADHLAEAARFRSPIGRPAALAV